MRYVHYSVKYGGNRLNGLTELTLFRYNNTAEVHWLKLSAMPELPRKHSAGSNDDFQGGLCYLEYFWGQKIRFFRTGNPVFNKKNSFFLAKTATK